MPSKIRGNPLIFREEARVFFSHMAEKNGENLGERGATSEPVNRCLAPRARRRECNVASEAQSFFAHPGQEAGFSALI